MHTCTCAWTKSLLPRYSKFSKRAHNAPLFVTIPTTNECECDYMGTEKKKGEGKGRGEARWGDQTSIYVYYIKITAAGAERILI
jgi:hypothetical protein